LKRNRIVFYFIAAVVVLFTAWIIQSSLSQPGEERFSGKFEELAFYRNENNTGPVIRIFLVKAANSDLSLMKEFGESRPHTKYGKTLVFFFSPELKENVTISPKEPYFPQEFQPYLLAQFERTPMGEVRFSSSNP
jgi:hypothetical protein